MTWEKSGARVTPREIILSTITRRAPTCRHNTAFDSYMNGLLSQPRENEGTIDRNRYYRRISLASYSH